MRLAPVTSGISCHHKGSRYRRKTVACAQPAAALKEVTTASGHVSIDYLQPSDVQGAGLLLTRAFSGTPEAVKFEEAVTFMQRHVAADGDEVTLVAKLVPSDASLLPPGKPNRLVGTVSLSFSDAARESFASLRPPPDQPYLSNMAVDPKFRRQGIARAMLDACDKAVQDRCQQVIWLHVRQADEAAQQLYSSYGFSEVDRDKLAGFSFQLFGSSVSIQRPRILMTRELTS